PLRCAAPAAHGCGLLNQLFPFSCRALFLPARPRGSGNLASSFLPSLTIPVPIAVGLPGAPGATPPRGRNSGFVLEIVQAFRALRLPAPARGSLLGLCLGDGRPVVRCVLL